LSQQRRKGRQYCTRSNKTPTGQGRRPLSDAIIDDQSAARSVRHLLRRDWREHFLRTYRQSLAGSGCWHSPRFVGRVDRSFTQRHLATLVFFRHVRALARFDFRESADGVGCFALSTRNDAMAVRLIVYAIFAYLGMMLAMRSSRDEFSLIIPYVRFARET